MSCNLNEEKLKVINKVSYLLTGGVVKLELSNEAWCALFELSIEEYIEQINKFLIEDNYNNLYGKYVNKDDICLALTTKTLDYANKFAQAFSEDVGLSSRGGRFELKKDFVELEEGRQVYQIPAGREVKNVLLATPSQIEHATFASWGYGNMFLGMFGGTGFYGSTGGGTGPYGGMYYMFPVHDIVLRAMDFGLKDRILNSELSYKITKGPSGTRLLHIFSVPKEKRGLRKQLYGCRIWYEYYDVTSMNDEDKQLCAEACSHIYAPFQITLPEIDYCDLNTYSKIWIRKYLTAYAKESLGRARGKFKGKIVNLGGSEIELDYDILLSEALTEKEKLLQELKDHFEYLRSENVLEREAKKAEFTKQIKSNQPLLPDIF
jgi:hypothetical protein